MQILVTGGAGYIGSFMTKRLLDDGHSVVVADNLGRGHKEAIDTRAKFHQGDLMSSSFVSEIFEKSPIDAVIHFAGYISMGESMEHPSMYFVNNTFAAENILECMHKAGVFKFIFSSTAGVYGNPQQVPIPEIHPKHPTNPYGESKLMVEQILSWYQEIHGINYVALRYFNASGAALDGSMGEAHIPETHIIPNAIACARAQTPFSLYGTDYGTVDGTCVRDYIHVLDLVEAHVLSLQKLEKDSGGFTYNVGVGKGYSNKEVLDMVSTVSGINFPVVANPRRNGDANTLIADSSKIRTELSFVPQHSDLKTIVESAWKWHNKHSK